MTIYSIATKPYLYVWLDTLTKKRYIGIHNGSRGYSYIGSGTVFRREYNTRPNDFLRVKIIHHRDYNYIQKLESRFLKRVRADLDETYYNMVWRAPPNTLGRQMSSEEKALVSKRFRGVKKSDYQRKKMSEAKIGRKYSDRHRVNMSNAHTGMIFTESHKESLSSIAKARPTVNCPHCNKIGKLNQMKRWHFDNCKLFNT